MNSRESNPFLNVTEAAEYLRLTKRTLDNMRWMGTGQSFANMVDEYIITLKN